jgi:hypothetical protein
VTQESQNRHKSEFWSLAAAIDQNSLPIGRFSNNSSLSSQNEHKVKSSPRRSETWIALTAQYVTVLFSRNSLNLKDQNCRVARMVRKRPDLEKVGVRDLTQGRCRVLHLFEGAQCAHSRVEMPTFVGVLNVAREDASARPLRLPKPGFGPSGRLGGSQCIRQPCPKPSVMRAILCKK